MRENLTGLVKIIGITILLFALWAILAWWVPDKFLQPNNVENLLRRTALFGILGIGVAFVIISSGIDLSIGSLVCFMACLLALFLAVDYQPYGATDVLEIKSIESRLIVAPTDRIQPGQRIWYYGGRRSRNAFLTVEQVATTRWQGRPAMDVRVEGKLTRDDVADATNRRVGRIVTVCPLKQSGTDRLTLSDAPQMRSRDRIWLIHPDQGLHERTVIQADAASDDTISVQLSERLPNIDSAWKAIPLERSQRMPIPVAIFGVLAIAIGLGWIHGLLITRLNLQPFVVTLCGLLIYRGLSRWLANDQTLGFGNEYETTLSPLATGRWVLWETDTSSFGIPYPFFVLIGLTLAAIVFLNATIWGRYILALGRNEEAARFSGVPTRRMTVLAYMLSAGLAGGGAILFALDSNSISPSSFGNFFELYAIAAAVLGGCSLRGGEGSILGVVVGTALMQTLYNSIVLLKIPDELEYAIIGTVILLGVASDEVIRRVAARLKKEPT